MRLSNSQYNLIMNDYSEQRFHNVHELDERIGSLYSRLPRLKEIRDSISSLSVECARKMLLCGADAKFEKTKLKSSLEELRKEQHAILAQNGYNEDYLNMHYNCELCHDTGYVGNEQCICLKNRIIKLLYQQSNLDETLLHENFDNFKTNYYNKNNIDSITGTTPYENIVNILNMFDAFIKSFDDSDSNIYMYGETGVGKTFLSNCVAKKLMDSGHSVIYLPAIKLFDLLSDETFNHSSDKLTESLSISRYLYDCDLLIIDDLGTELANSFTTTELFNCINERMLNKKHTLISSNLSPEKIKAIYSERIFSRLTTYTIIKVIGDDIRIKKSLSS